MVQGVTWETPTRARDNPFRVERIHALGFRFPPGGPSALIARFEQLGRRAVVVGPEGSGKSTLLEHLVPYFAAAGGQTHHFAARPNEAPPKQLRARLAALGAGDVLLLDGFDHLSLLARLGLLHRIARTGAGLLATSHVKERLLPTLLDLAPTPELLEALAHELTNDASISGLFFAEIHRRHGGNLRTALRELYDLWAARTR